ncbi:hypothetical protein CAEBREN_08372 [Caenorhabditis brenneri]|uniref:Uncharacterized protein n=1 Tax=Caenorhabditis brenneri TaxID=135651 RepID=G0M9V9_CAEBE|nr:hypothetical protein CAEBREN_08372 [Caenorhabditis brenneri]
MSENSTSSPSFLFFIENASPQEIDLLKEVLKIEALITYGVVLGILGACLLFCLPSYLSWFKYSLKNYSGMIYVTFQVLLYTSLGFQSTLKSDLTASPSEKLIVKHIKWIGSIKLGLFVITAICLFSEFEIAIALTLFFSVDMFLVPLVVEVTEISSDKKIVKTNGMKLEALKL